MKNNKTLLKKMKSHTRKTGNVEYSNQLANFVESLAPTLNAERSFLTDLMALLRLEKNVNENDITHSLLLTRFSINNHLEDCEDYFERSNVETIEKLFTEICTLIKPCVKKSIWNKHDSFFNIANDKEQFIEMVCEDEDLLNDVFGDLVSSINEINNADDLDEAKDIMLRQIGDMMNKENAELMK